MQKVALGTTEAESNLKIALKVQNLLEQSGATVILTRSDENAIYDIDSNQTSLDPYTGVIGQASEKEIAKHFVKACNLGIERDYGDE